MGVAMPRGRVPRGAHSGATAGRRVCAGRRFHLACSGDPKSQSPMVGQFPPPAAPRQSDGCRREPRIRLHDWIRFSTWRVRGSIRTSDGAWL